MALTALRAVATASAGIWLGGMILMAIVAQTTFGVMRTTDVAQPNAVAGKVMAKNFARFDRVQLICAGVLVVWQAAHMLSGGTAWRDWLRLALIAGATGLLTYSVLVLTPRITDLQSALAAADVEQAVKAVFDGFHAAAVRISKINLVLLLAIVLEMATPKSTASRAGPVNVDPVQASRS